MDPTLPVLIVFHGDAGPGAGERLVAGVRAAAAVESARAALAAGFGGVIAATDDPSALGAMPEGVVLDADPPGSRFDFGERLRDIVRRFALAKPVVMGSGSLPLLSPADFKRVAVALDEPGVVVTNNLFSGDLTGWSPGDAVQTVGELARDNMLPRRLRDLAGLRPVTLPRTAATQFDIDTPADVCVLALQDELPAGIRAAIGEGPLPLAAYRKVMGIVCDPKAELVIAGRVGSAAWPYLETETACRVRLLSEERGMAAAGPEHRVRSMAGFLLEAVGISGFFERMAQLGDGIVIDTRVIEAHLGLKPSREDRFQSDLLNFNGVRDPFLREFTRSAHWAPKPVLLGGHSLVSGGLMALTDVAWREEDIRKAVRNAPLKAQR